MPKYKVLRCDGWPIMNPGSGTPEHVLGETFESDSTEDVAGVSAGYLEVVASAADQNKRKSDVKPEPTTTKDETSEPTAR